MTIQNTKYSNTGSKDSHKSIDANGWPVGFFEETYGCLQGVLSDREPQGEYERRLELNDNQSENID